MTIYYSDIVTAQTSPTSVELPVIGAQVYVLLQNGTQESLTDANGNTINQPVISGPLGQIAFYVPSPGQVYQFQYYYGGRLIREDEVIIGNPPQFKGDPGAAGNVAVGINQLTSGPASEATANDLWELSSPNADGGMKLVNGVSVTQPPTNAIDVPIPGRNAYFARYDTREYIANWWGVVGDGTEGANPTGTDNTAAFQTALNETKARGGRRLRILPGQYNISGPLTSPSGAAGPAQVFLPATNLSKDTHEFALEICGCNPPGSYIIDPRSTAIIQSTLPGQGGACLGSLSLSGNTNAALAAYYFRDLCLRGMPNPGITMLDAYYIPILDMERVTCDVANLNNGYVEPTYDGVPSIRGPANNVPLWNNYDDLVIYGWNTGIQPGELFSFGNVNISNVKWLMRFIQMQHPGKINRLVATSFENGIDVTGNCEVDIWYDCEHNSRPGWAPNSTFTGYDIYDTVGYLRGPSPRIPGRFHLHELYPDTDIVPFNIVAPNYNWVANYPWQRFNVAYREVYPGMRNSTDARSVWEHTANIGKTAFLDTIVQRAGMAPGDVVAQYATANMSNQGAASLVALQSILADATDDKSFAWAMSLLGNGTLSKMLGVSSTGRLSIPFLGVDQFATKAAAQAAGVQNGQLYMLSSDDMVRYMR